jgi:hypothetical protein
MDVNGFWRVTGDATPWFSAYRHQFFETLRFSEYEFVDQPVACKLVLYHCSGRFRPASPLYFPASTSIGLFAVAASDENPVSTYRSLLCHSFVVALTHTHVLDCANGVNASDAQLPASAAGWRV